MSGCGNYFEINNYYFLFKYTYVYIVFLNNSQNLKKKTEGINIKSVQDLYQFHIDNS